MDVFICYTINVQTQAKIFAQMALDICVTITFHRWEIILQSKRGLLVNDNI